MHRRTVLVIALALATITPSVALAEWRGRGFYEPDTERDVLGGWMFANPDVSPSGSRVYFSAYGGQSAGSHTPLNPNSALLGTQIMPYPTVVSALLGVWKDCNKDGYVGIAEGIGFAQWPASDNGVYSTEDVNDLLGEDDPGVPIVRTHTFGSDASYNAMLLTTLDVCPPGTPHNDGVAVREYMGIGPRIDADEVFPIEDNAARVWGDFGYPEDSAQASCALNPRPRGTYQSTGGFLRFSDCFLNWRITGAVNDVAAQTGLSMLSFGDAPHNRPDQSGSVLNQPNPWGHEDDDAYVQAFDCSAPVEHHDDTGMTHVGVDDPTGGQLSGPQQVPGVVTITIFNKDTHRLWIANVSDEDHDIFVAGGPTAPQANPGGSMGGTVNETTEAQSGTGSCDRNDDAGVVGSGEIYEAEEGNLEGTASKRVQTDHWFSPSFDEEYWQGALGYVASRNPYVNRDNLQPWGAVVVSIYAYVSPAPGLTFASAATGVYGSPHCSGATEITGAFNCDADQWYRGPNGEDIASDWQMRVGASYHALDVDCYDAAVARGTPGPFESVGQTICERP